MPNTNHQTTNMEELIEDICANVSCDAEPRHEYSGRGMYGDICHGIVTSSPLKVVEQAAVMGLFGAEIDSMGRSSIVYWPRPKVTNEALEAYPKPEDQD